MGAMLGAAPDGAAARLGAPEGADPSPRHRAGPAGSGCTRVPCHERRPRDPPAGDRRAPRPHDPAGPARLGADRHRRLSGSSSPRSSSRPTSGRPSGSRRCSWPSPSRSCRSASSSRPSCGSTGSSPSRPATSSSPSCGGRSSRRWWRRCSTPARSRSSRPRPTRPRRWRRPRWSSRRSSRRRRRGSSCSSSGGCAGASSTASPTGWSTRASARPGSPSPRTSTTSRPPTPTVGERRSPARSSLRCLLSPFAHPMFTILTGIGIGVAATSRTWPPRVVAPVAGYLLAVLAHALWNLAAVSGGQGLVVVYLLVEVPVFVAFLVFVGWVRRHEGHLIGQFLRPYADAGWLSPAEVTMLASMPRRREARAWARANTGRAGLAAMRGFQDTASELALLRRRMSHSAADTHALARGAPSCCTPCARTGTSSSGCRSRERRARRRPPDRARSSSRCGGACTASRSWGCTCRTPRRSCSTRSRGSTSRCGSGSR